MTDCPLPPKGKIGFLGLGFFELFQSQVPGTEGGSPNGQNIDLIQEPT